MRKDRVFKYTAQRIVTLRLSKTALTVSNPTVGLLLTVIFTAFKCMFMLTSTPARGVRILRVFDRSEIYELIEASNCHGPHKSIEVCVLQTNAITYQQQFPQQRYHSLIQWSQSRCATSLRIYDDKRSKNASLKVMKMI